jgi:site-specific recombinase XerD
MYEEIYKGRMLHLERMLKEYQELGYKEAMEFDNRLIMRNSQKLTRQTYHSILLRFLKATNKPVSQITYEDVEKYIIDLKKRGVSNQTLINNIAGIESFFKFLYSHPGTGKKRRQEIELILKLLKDKPKLQSSRDREIISEEEYEKLIAAFDSVRDKVITAVLYNTGARIAEVLTLKLKNVVYVGNNLMLKFEGGSKTKLHEKLIALTRARRMFEDYLNLMGYKNSEDYIFRASQEK